MPPTTATRLTITYAFLSLIAIIANLSAQEVFVWIYTGALGIYLAIAVGTGVGLIVKYALDKRYIFYFRARGAAHDAEIFTLYALTGLTTTLIFWGCELSFHFLFEAKGMRYLGGAIGLTTGYLVKFHLDKRYVFKVENQCNFLK